MKILIATDAYFPQVNGVVRTLHETGNILKEQGHRIEYITPDLFFTFPMPKSVSYTHLTLPTIYSV